MLEHSKEITDLNERREKEKKKKNASSFFFFFLQKNSEKVKRETNLNSFKIVILF